MKFLKRALIGVAVLVVALQLARPGIPVRSAKAELDVPPQVNGVLDKSCFSCHSDERRLAWFDEVVPAYWLVRADILTARRHLDFSTLGAKPRATQKAALYEAVNMMQLGAMPLPRFLALHPEARVSAADVKVIKDYLAPWAMLPPAAAPEETGAVAVPVVLQSVKPEWNGVAFDPGFEQWTPISTTDRGDNNTFRFVLGNGVAVKAAQTGAISPWPDGTRFAKVAWQQVLGADGLIHPGKFVQVEFMMKDARAYKKTDGWGWARWRGLDLKPYGVNAGFVRECTSCHLPVRGDDSVYTMPMTAAHIDRQEVVNNRAMSLPQGLPYQPLGWGAITMFVDPKNHTTATLYGNAPAMTALRSLRAQSGKSPAYPAGAVVALVTWAQRDDPHWFGARIPDVVRSVEFVEVGQTNRYRKFAETGEVKTAAADGASRASWIVGLPAVEMP